MTLTQADLAERMRAIDTSLVATTTPKGLETRPMSNNRDVDWDGTSWFFALEETGLVQQATADPHVLVTCTGERGLWIATTGRARVHDDRTLMAEHWDPDIDRWFGQGVDTPGLRLIEVVGEHVRYWTYEDGDGEIDLRAAAPTA